MITAVRLVAAKQLETFHKCVNFMKVIQKEEQKENEQSPSRSLIPYPPSFYKASP